MPYDDPDPQDPMMLVGVALPADRSTQLEMAYAFAEEFTRLGYDERQVMSLFREPFYAGANGLYKQLGEGEVEAIVRETASTWGRMRLVDHDAVPHAAAPDAEETGHE